MTDCRVAAVDLGAGSIRVATVDLAATCPQVQVVHRWHNTPTRASDGSLRWDWPRIVDEVEQGLLKAASMGPLASIGVDGWGVDYGLLDAGGDLVSLPFSYRDSRTDIWRSTAESVGPDLLYSLTGIQLMPINTIFQLAVHSKEELRQADRLLLLPDLMVRSLSGFEGAERSNASTTALLDVTDGTWCSTLLDGISVPSEIFPELIDAGTSSGSWRGIPITAVGSHDTASAFLGMPGAPEPGTAFVSTGTWILVGIERAVADISDAARGANFSNERGALGGFRFLKNLAGFWMLEECRPAWGSPPVEILIAEAEAVRGPVPTVDVMDSRFLSPASMLDEIVLAASFDSDPERAVVVRCILESIARGVATVLDEMSAITGTEVRRVSVVGGGARVGFLNQLLAERTGLPVVAGSTEATALGNAVVQGLGIGQFGTVEEARGWLASTGTPYGQM